MLDSMNHGMYRSSRKNVDAVTYPSADHAFFNDTRPEVFDKKAAEDAVKDWAESTRARNLDDHMKHYADMLETYYKRQKVGAFQVRTDRNNAFTRYDKMDVIIDNVEVTSDPTGLRATVAFDKTWDFDSPDRNSTGSVRQQLTLTRVGGRWLITGEKDLEVHYSNSTEDGTTN